MGDPAVRRATYDDVLAAPDGWTAELVNGELFLSPRPRATHLGVEGDLYADLREAFGRRRGGPGPGGWVFLIEPELHLGVPHPNEIVAVPDVAGWRRERLPDVPDTAAITLLPDWICEVVSPGARNVRRDRIVKPDLYATLGVPWLWLVDPVAQLLEVFRLQAGTYARAQAFSGDEIVHAQPFDAVTLDIGGWWPPTSEDPG